MALKAEGGYQEQREHLSIAENWCLTGNKGKSPMVKILAAVL